MQHFLQIPDSLMLILSAMNNYFNTSNIRLGALRCSYPQVLFSRQEHLSYKFTTFQSLSFFKFGSLSCLCRLCSQNTIFLAAYVMIGNIQSIVSEFIVYVFIFCTPSLQILQFLCQMSKNVYPCFSPCSEILMHCKLLFPLGSWLSGIR